MIFNFDEFQCELKPAKNFVGFSVTEVCEEECSYRGHVLKDGSMGWDTGKDYMGYFDGPDEIRKFSEMFVLIQKTALEMMK